MLLKENLKVGKQYDLVYRSGGLYKDYYFEGVFGELVGRYIFTDTLSRTGNSKLKISIPPYDLGPDKDCEVYEPGIGAQVSDIRNAYIKEYRLIKDRKEALTIAGYVVESRPMGPGGVGQVRTTQKEIRIQIGAAYTKWGYAMCVILPNNLTF